MENIRKSSYVVTIQLNDSNYMLIHGYTGAMDVVSKRIVDYLTHYDSKKSNCMVNQKDIDLLIHRGYLTNMTEEHEMDLVMKIASSIHNYRKQQTKKFYILVGYECNFRCHYCYEKGINAHYQNENRVFKIQMVDKAYETMSLIEPDKDKRIKEIMLYGGEPLMAENATIVKYIVQKGHSLGYKFGAITNGYDLNKFENLLGPNYIDNLQITIDGPKSFHDKRRFHWLYGGSFDKIMNNVTIALKKNVRVVIRMNIDSDNSETISELNQAFIKNGFYEFEKFSFYPAILEKNLKTEQNSDKNRIKYLSKETFEQLNKHYWQPSKRGTLYDIIYSSITNKKPLPLRPIYCGAQEGLYILDPVGNIYCCLEIVGRKENIIGSYLNGLKWNEQYKRWHYRNIGEIPNCKKCSYAFFCGGGCCAKIKNLNLCSPSCNQFPKIFDISVKKAYEFYMHSV